MATNTTGTESAPARQTPMDSMRKAAMWAGALYLLTFVSIPTLALYALGAAVSAASLPRLKGRLDLSRAKHPSLRGHARISSRRTMSRNRSSR